MKEHLKKRFDQSYENLIGKLDDWVNTFVTNIPNLIIAIIVFVITYYLSGIIKRYAEKLLKKRVKEPSLRSLIATMSAVAVVLLGIFLGLAVLNLDTVLKSMLAGAGVAGLAIGLALQSSLSNTFSGIYLSVNDVLHVGDWIETNGYQGTVHEVNLRNTLIKEPDNNLVMIPNRLVVENPFKNYGLTEQVRVIVNCGIAYESDLQFVENVTKEAIEKNFPTDEDKPIEFYYREFGDSSINFQVRFYVAAKAKLSILESQSKAIKVIKAAFDDEGINIPFPIRTVYMNNQ